MSDDLLARILLRQATLTTARCASLIYGYYRGGDSIADLALRFGLDESTIDWWCMIGGLKTPRDAPSTFLAPDPTPLKTYARTSGDD
jgi:hypothetical protein